jgi:hypothetical protein
VHYGAGRWDRKEDVGAAMLRQRTAALRPIQVRAARSDRTARSDCNRNERTAYCFFIYL